jgi:hypothetical protein
VTLWVCSGMGLIDGGVGGYQWRYVCSVDSGRLGGNFGCCGWFCRHGFKGFG